MFCTARTRPEFQDHTAGSSGGVLSNPAAEPSRLPRPGVSEGVDVCEEEGVAVCVELGVPVCVWLAVPVCEEEGVPVCD